jgi:flagellar FliL protein
MAKAPEKTADPADAAAAAPAGGNKKMLIIIVALVAVLVIGGGAAAFLLMKKPHASSEEEEAKQAKIEKEKKQKSEAPPVIVKLDQFTVKLTPDEGRPEQYMQTTVELEVTDAPVAERIKLFMPKIRARLLLLMMGKTPTDLSTPQGVERMAIEMRNEINQIIDGTTRPPETLKATPDDSIQAVYLTQFIIQ